MANPTDPPDQPLLVAPLWRRLVASIFDLVLLGAPTFLFGMLFFQTAAGLGHWGRLIGFFAATIYFALMDSHVGLGRTIGKRMAEIRVVGRDGELLSVPRAAARFLIIGIPWYLDGAYFDFGDVLPRWAHDVVGILLTVIVFGGIGAILYLFVFNRRTRQSLHDLGVDSFVVLESRRPAPIATSTAMLHYVMVSCWLTLTLIVASGLVWYGHQSDRMASMSPLIELQAAVRQDSGLSHVGVAQGSTAMASLKAGLKTTTFLQVTVAATIGSDEVEALKRAIARAVLSRHADLLGQEVLIVRIQRSFDFWFSAWTVEEREALTAAEWQSKLALSQTGGADSTNAHR